MKILVCGDVNGNFKTLMTRLESLLKKNAGFDMVLCAGSFFSDSQLCEEEWSGIKQGTITVPLPIFILGPQSEDVVKYYQGVSADGGEITKDITCLGQRGVYKTINGLLVAYLSGHFNPSKYSIVSKPAEDSLVSYFTKEHVRSLTSYPTGEDDFKGVDILLTMEWPHSITKDVDPPEGINDIHKIGSSAVSRVAHVLKPRYHFTSKMERFYERRPYRNHEVLVDEQRHVTRFIVLANAGNSDKKNRYLYAFSIEPLRNMDRSELVRQPQIVTNNPYTDLVKAAAKDSVSSDHGASGGSGDGGSYNFFFDSKAIAAGKKRQQREQDRLLRQLDPSSGPSKRHKPPQPKGPCWFCLGSAEVEKHLIVSIGNSSYTAIPKGPLVDGHVLIIPIGHYSSMIDAPREVNDEIMEFKKALRNYFASKDKSCVMFERNYRSQHLQIQVVPVPECESDALRQAFKEHAKSSKMEFMEIPRDVDIAQVLPSGAAYFHAEFDSGPSLLCRITGFMSLQFGREVLASPLILNVPNRINWKSCAQSKDQESASSEKFRQNFKSFDFTLEDSDDDD